MPNKVYLVFFVLGCENEEVDLSRLYLDKESPPLVEWNSAAASKSRFARLHVHMSHLFHLCCTVCPGSSDPPEKILNIFASENEVYTIF